MTLDASLRDWLRLSRLATDPAGRTHIVPLVAEMAARHVGADAALVALIDGETMRISAAHGCHDTAFEEWELDPDALGPELEEIILERCRKVSERFEIVRSAPLIADAALFGSLVVVFESAREIGDDSLQILAGIADLAALTLSSASQFDRLERVNVELRATRAVLEKTEKLRALGEMAAGVSHDLKNILNPLGLYMQLAQRQLASGEVDQARTSLDEMRGVVRRGTDLLESLRHFSRQAPDALEQQVDLNALAREAMQIAKPRMSSGRRAMPRVVEQLADPPTVLARATEVVSAIVNLLANAQDVVSSGGTITVRTGAQDDGAFVEVEDDGPGMAPDVRERIFEPFFTTKGDAGTGLGLAMVYATMLRHGGKAEVTSELGEGTRIRLWFPTRDEPRPSPQ